MSSFEMIGSVKLAKGNEKFPTYEVKTFGSGWQRKMLRLNISADGNSHNVEISGMFGGDDSTIYSMVKKESNKYENIKFKYSERDKYIKDLAEFKKYVFVNGEDRHEFATQQELAEFVHTELVKEEYKDKKFIVKGDIEFSEYNNKKYTNYNVTRMYVVKDDGIEEKCEGQLELYITDEYLDDSSFDETNKMYINGYVGVYDKNKKADIGISQTVEVYIPDEVRKREKKKDRITENLKVENVDVLSKIGIKVDLFGKAPNVEFDDSMLTDEEKEDLELGFITLEELKAEYGSGKGSFERKFVFKGWARGYSKGCMETTTTLEQLLSKAAKIEKPQSFEIDDNDEFDFEEDYGLDD